MNNISNCQVELTTTDEVYNRIFKSFICEYDKTKDWKIIDWTCYHATFDSNNNCKELISYEKKPEISCPTWQHVNYYWSCECSESEYLKNGICYNKCWTNAHYDYYEKWCYCNDWYFNSESLWTCVKSLY